MQSLRWELILCFTELQHFSLRCNYFPKIRTFRKKNIMSTVLVCSLSFRPLKRKCNQLFLINSLQGEKNIYIYLTLPTSQSGPPTPHTYCLVKVTWNKGVQVRLQGPELVDVVVSLLLCYPPRVIWVVGIAVLLLPLPWKRLKGETLAPAASRGRQTKWGTGNLKKPDSISSINRYVF